MKLSIRDGMWVFKCDQGERLAPKDAGFWFHGSSPCRREGHCSPCEKGVEWAWWLPDLPRYTDCAVRLRDYADDGARARIETYLNSLDESRPTGPDSDIVIPVPGGQAYLPYQRAGILYCAQRKWSLIGDEMGLGKTIQALGLVNLTLDHKPKVLVVCPASLRLNWLREAKKWLTAQDLVYHVVDKDSPVPLDANVVIVNYDRLKSRVWPSLIGREWDMLIIDEAHYLKNPKAGRTKKVLGCKDQKGLVHYARGGVFLTGTPILNRPVELHPLAKAIDPERFGNWVLFVKQYCAGFQKYVRTGRSVARIWDVSGSSNLDKLQRELRASFLIRRLKSEVLTELPAKRRQVVVLPMDPATRRVIASEGAEVEMWRKRSEALAAALAAAEVSDDPVRHEEALRALGAGERAAFTAISAIRHVTALAKVPVVASHLRDQAETGKQLVVFAHHKDVIKRLSAAIKDGTDTRVITMTGDDPLGHRQAAVDLFQRNGVQVIIGTIGAMGVGWTLTASANVYFCELDWTPSKLSQAEDRTHRIGQTNSVLVQHLVLDESIDQHMAEKLVEKQRVIDGALGRHKPEPVVAMPWTSARIIGVVGLNSSPRTNPPDPIVKRKATPTSTPTPTPTVEQSDVALACLRHLAEACDGANALDGMGFNKMDTARGKALAALERLGPGQTSWAARLAVKYHGQLPPDAVAVLRPLVTKQTARAEVRNGS